MSDEQLIIKCHNSKSCLNELIAFEFCLLVDGINWLYFQT